MLNAVRYRMCGDNSFNTVLWQIPSISRRQPSLNSQPGLQFVASPRFVVLGEQAQSAAWLYPRCRPPLPSRSPSPHASFARHSSYTNAARPQIPCPRSRPRATARCRVFRSAAGGRRRPSLVPLARLTGPAPLARRPRHVLTPLARRPCRGSDGEGRRRCL